MQQTTTYKLNKPESTDTFSVSPLNENADTLEAQLARLDGADAAETAARTAETAALDQRVTALEAKKVAAGTYVGTGTEHEVELGFAPVAVIASTYSFTSGVHIAMTTPNFTVYGFKGKEMWLTENGFALGNGNTLNSQGGNYAFLALG